MAIPCTVDQQELALKMLVLSKLPPAEEGLSNWKVYVQYDAARHAWLLAIEVKKHHVSQWLPSPLPPSRDAFSGIVDGMVTVLARSIARQQLEKEDFNVQDYQERLDHNPSHF